MPFGPPCAIRASGQAKVAQVAPQAAQACKSLGKVGLHVASKSLRNRFEIASEVTVRSNLASFLGCTRGDFEVILKFKGSHFEVILKFKWSLVVALVVV